MKPIRNRLGETHGMLTVINYLGMPMINGRKRTLWRCKCECGKTCEVTGCQLSNGRQSCGCLLDAARRLSAAKGRAAYSAKAAKRRRQRRYQREQRAKGVKRMIAYLNRQVPTHEVIEARISQWMEARS